MIEFDGYISGVAEKHVKKKERNLGLKIGYISITLVLPMIVFIAYGLKQSFGLEMWKILAPYLLLFIVVPLICFIPSKDKRYNTCKVFTDVEYIVAVLGTGREEFKLISDVKIVNDYGEFYELIFPWEKGISNHFICQKDLLTKGSLDEFEALFEGKIKKIGVAK